MTSELRSSASIPAGLIYSRASIPSGDAFIGCLGLITRQQGEGHFQRGRIGPDQFGMGWMSFDGRQKSGESVAISLFAVLPAVHAMVEMDDVEFSVIQHEGNFLKQNRVGNETRGGESGDISLGCRCFSTPG